MSPINFGIIGGSGLYRISGIQDVAAAVVGTPFSPPSGVLVTPLAEASHQAKARLAALLAKYE